MNITGKVALVTGAASGIGRATAQALAQAGAAVLVVDIDAAGGAETVRTIEAGGGRAALAEADVSTPAGIRSMFAAAHRHFGGVDIVHNNAGIVGGANPAWPETSLERISQIIATNLAGVIMGTQAAIDAFRTRGGGVVINSASSTALVPFPYEPVYVATKAGIVLFTQSCKTLKETHNVRVNAILPTFVDTPIFLKAGDGINRAPWAAAAIRLMGPPVPPSAAAAVVLEIVRDESLAGEARQISVPQA